MRNRLGQLVAWQHVLASLIGVGCSGSSGDITHQGELDAGSDAQTQADGDAQVMQPPFERPEYVPHMGSCGFEQPAFCDTFETIAGKSGRTGELDAAHWSATRGNPSDHPDLEQAFRVGPALLPACRPDLPARALPNDDIVICDPISTVPTRHLMTATAAQNYGLNGYRIRQPFDFSGRTGTIKFDADLRTTAWVVGPQS
ncbi:MAG: hypothetical protein QM778_05745 [Myxococcales bacterium]